MDKPNHMKLRTTIMVASMIALPMAAVLGLKWPHFQAAEQATAQAHDHDHRHGHTHPTEQGGTATPPAPAWGASATNTSPNMATTAHAVAPVTSAPPRPDQTLIPAAVGNATSIAAYPVLQAANHDVRAVSSTVTESNTGRFMLGVGGSSARVVVSPPVDARMGSYSYAGVVAAPPVDESSAIRPLPVPAETAPAPASPGASDPFSQIQQRLRALGALHYSLETWGSQGEAYRFQCRMAAGHSPNYSRHFEATDVDPLRVMQTVLVEIESWKSGRLP